MPISPRRSEDWLTVMDAVALPSGANEILTDMFLQALCHDGSGEGNLTVEARVRIALTSGDVEIDVRDYCAPADNKETQTQDDQPIYTSGHDKFIHFSKTIGGAGTYQGSIHRDWLELGSGARFGFVQNPQDSGGGTMTVEIRRGRLTGG